MHRRPLTLISIAFISGIVLNNILRISISHVALYLFISLISIPYIFKKQNLSLIILLPILLLGALNSELNYELGDSLNTFTNEEISIYGNVIQKNIREYDEYYLLADKVFYKDDIYAIDEKIILKVYNSENQPLEIDNKYIIVKGILRKPEPNRNSGMFNYQRYLKSRGIHSIVYSDMYSINIIKEGNLTFYEKYKGYIKNYIYKNSMKVLGGAEGEIALSIVFGDKSILDEEIYEAFRFSGVAHILAVSGLHFGILYLFLNSFLTKIRLSHRYKSTLIISIIWMFAALVGFPISGIRAATMLTLYIISNHLDRRYDLFTSLFLVALISLIINPLLVYDVGFQLSFVAVFSIGVFYKQIFNRLKILPSFLNKMISASLSAQIGTIPIIAYHFNVLTPWAIFFNLPIIFLTGYIMPLTLIYFLFLPMQTSLATLIGAADNFLIKILIFISQLVYKIPYSIIQVTSPRIFNIVFYYIFLIILFKRINIKFFKRIGKYRLIIFLIIISISINVIPNFYNNKLIITFIDVGQGDSILIRTPKEKNILIDGGSSQRNPLVTQFLLKNHISKLDLVFLSHIHSDHIGGILDVVKNINTKQVLIGNTSDISDEFVELLESNKKYNIPIKQISTGDVVNIENEIKISILNPPISPVDYYEGDDINNNSLVLLLEYKKFSALFTGDLEVEGEDLVMENYTKDNLTLLKVAHHGSKSATSKEFLELIQPKVAVIQVGRNTYGHPNEEIINRLQSKNIKTYRNDRDGAVIIYTEGKSMIINKTIREAD